MCRIGLLSKDVLLHRDNAHIPIAATHDTIWRMIFQILKHPSYSPDLAPSDYKVFVIPIDASGQQGFGNYLGLTSLRRMFL